MKKPLLVISPSAAESWRLCPRKWAWRKIAGIETPQTPAAELGTRTHTILENGILHYLAKGDTRGFDCMSDPQAGPLAARLFPLIPFENLRYAEPFLHPKKPAETKFEFALTPEISIRGTVDFIAYYPEEDTWEIGDFKTTKDLKWIKDLSTDVPAACYARWAQVAHPQSNVRLRWLYVTTAGNPKTHVATTEATDQSGIASIIRTASEIILARHHYQTADQYPTRHEACSAFGGCGYRNLCNLSILDEDKDLPMNFPAHMVDSANRLICGPDGRPVSERAHTTGQLQNAAGQLFTADPVNAETWGAIALDCDQVAQGALQQWGAAMQAVAIPAYQPPPAQAVPTYQAPPPSPAHLTLYSLLHKLGISALLAGLDAYHATQAGPDGIPWDAIPTQDLPPRLAALRAAAPQAPYAPQAAIPTTAAVLPPESLIAPLPAPAAPPVPPAEPKKRGPGRPKKAAGEAPAPAAPVTPHTHGATLTDTCATYTLYIGVHARESLPSDVQLSDYLAAGPVSADELIANFPEGARVFVHPSRCGCNGWEALAPALCFAAADVIAA